MVADFTTLSCPSCGAQTRVDVFAERMVCEYCGNEHILKMEKSPSLRPEIGQPPCVLIESDRKCARLIQRWFSLKYIPMAIFALAWDSFLFFWYSNAMSMEAPIFFFLFPVMHVAVGIGITYSAITGLINRTVLEVTRDEVALWFEPLPWLGEKTLRTRELKQFYCKEKVVRTKNGTSTQYELNVVTVKNQKIKLLGNIENPDVALFFEQQLERWLKIDDRPVEGELLR
jgi:hypothetical protein